MNLQHDTGSVAENRAPQGPGLSTSVIGGALIGLIGVGVAIYALDLSIGTITNMGPGFFPLILGIATAIVGGLCVLTGLRDTGRLSGVPLRPLVAVLASVSIFALMIRTTGLGPAAFCTTVVASFADDKSKIWQTLLLALFLVGFSALIFIKILGLPIPLVRMPL